MHNEPTLLYLIPTPIGNLADITYRAVDILKQVDLILAEDTRTSGILLKKYEISNRLKSFHIHNEHKVVSSIIEKLLAGTVIALISDAGTPGISDPGYLLVREALKNNINMEVLPGPTAFVPALVKSGFATDRFIFEGFLPVKKGRSSKIIELAVEQRTIILYESPHRLLKTLEQLKAAFGSDRQISVSRELTKIHEETKNGNIAEAIEYFSLKVVKGEIVIVISGGS